MMTNAHRIYHLALLLALTVLPQQGFGHHSFTSRFDASRTAEIEGKIARVKWRNPHIIFSVDVVAETGKVQTWEIEAHAAVALKRMGISRDMINVGDVVRMAGYVTRKPMPVLFGTNILLPDGRELILRPKVEARWKNIWVGSDKLISPTEGDISKPSLGIFRTWTGSFDRLLFPEALDPSFDLSTYPLTIPAKAKLDAYDIKTDSPILGCAPKGMPTIMEQPYPMEFSQGDDGNIILRIEEYDTVRTIVMGEATVVKPSIPSILGYSVGRWEDGTLVVATTELSWRYLNTMGIPLSEKAEVVERFTPSNDGSRLDYKLIVTDPVTFTEPVVRDHYWLYLANVSVQPFQCESNDA